MSLTAYRGIPERRPSKVIGGSEMPQIRSDQEMSVTETEGGTHVEADGDVRVDLEKISKISIDNIVRVQRYDLSSTDDFIIHKIDFVNGGTAVLGYAKSGKLMRFKTSGIVIAIENGDHITLDAVDE
jgi:hypothetical protein